MLSRLHVPALLLAAYVLLGGVGAAGLGEGSGLCEDSMLGIVAVDRWDAQLEVARSR